MKVCYVDETGTEPESPVVVMVGIVADALRLHRTQQEFEQAFNRLAVLPQSTLRELKSTHFYRGKAKWYGVDGHLRHAAIGDFCTWLGDRKHSLALAAIDKDRFPSSSISRYMGIWDASALHIALQIQRAHQSTKNNKGNTFLIFDENKQKADKLAETLFSPPVWTDDYYLKPKKARLDQIVDTACFCSISSRGTCPNRRPVRLFV